mmetsp:Transcript_66053/g.157950  ORF Transcript_66053/g.157950 Transcript_66053/m.157950 type:complete len:1191 (+) Transcript_66053:118-3690(+)
MAAAADGKQSFARRDFLHKIEADAQKKWADSKIFEEDAPDEAKEKFFVTFPYPYMNGLLHIGHAYSLTKGIFAAQFQKLLGKKVLFPFGFHCTGMPIQAAAQKLQREYELYGSPYPTFPAGRPIPQEDDGDDESTVTLAWKPPPSTGKKAIKCHHLLMRVGDGEFKEVATVEQPSAEQLKVQKGKVVFKAPVQSGGCCYVVSVELEDGSSCPKSKESDVVVVDAAGAAVTAQPKDGKKGGGGGKKVAKKILAKTGDMAWQWEIMRAMGMDEDMIPEFKVPEHWLSYYPPLGVRDLQRFGVPVDFRRSFITTSKNPYYDSFIRWQFRKLQKGSKIGFGKRPTIYSELDGQACMDHDRAEGEGVGPQEYTAVKIEILELPEAMKSLAGKKVYLLAATLRPETMCGQTNCWILPEGEYGCFKAPDDSVYVCSERSARNMSFQDHLAPPGKPELLLKVKGQDMMGAKIKAPTCPYDHIYLLPLLTIKMDKGTGVVTSVPSDSPDDYAAYMDLLKPGKLAHFGLKPEWIEPFPLIPIIDVEIDNEVRDMAAKYMCEKLGVQSQKDKEKLLEAHDTCYKLGFDKGVMTAGPLKGTPVKKAKLQLRQMMVDEGKAFLYSEPEKKVVSRSGDECVVASIDQWYLKYGEEEWRSQIEQHITGENFRKYNDRIQEAFLDAISWLREWACSRSFGLGTRVPWDEQFLIESLSDSTIYMAYYTVAHILQGGVIDGSEGSPEGIEPSDLTDEVWDYVFLKGPMPKETKIKEEVLKRMHKEFEFWYPMDLRVSGKDLIQNHLTMSLYNHACVWDDQAYWPRGFFCNGWLLVNNEKMSKSKGNFFTMHDICAKHSADATRIAAANAGDTLEDANFEEAVAQKAVTQLPVFLEKMQAFVKGEEPTDDSDPNTRFVDKWFANELNRLVETAKGYYSGMYFREALRVVYFEFMNAFDQYRDICKSGLGLPNKTLVLRYYEWQMIILSPICPHICEHGWGVLGKEGSVLSSRWPEPTSAVDISVMAQGVYMFDKVPHESLKLLEKTAKQGKAIGATAYVAMSFPDWKVEVLNKLRAKFDANAMPVGDVTKDEEKKKVWNEIVKELMQCDSLKPYAKHLGPFAAFKRDEAAILGAAAFDAKSSFDEAALLKEHASYLKDKLGMDVVVELAEGSEVDAAKEAQPGRPGMQFQIEAGSAPAAKAKSKAKAKA